MRRFISRATAQRWDGSVFSRTRITTPELHDALSAMGAGLILRALAEQPIATPQPAAGATYAPKLSKADGLLDWREPAIALDRRVRGMNPWPGAFFPLGPDNIRVLDAMAEPGTGAPGQQLSPGLIACGEGALRPLSRALAQFEEAGWQRPVAVARFDCTFAK
jgi:methionyl-tRNA formyltransferase